MGTMLRKWLRLADRGQRERMAEAAGTSTQYLEHLAASEDANYKRQPKVALAAAIERFSLTAHAESGGLLPIVRRTELVAACAVCPYAKHVLKGEAEAGLFPVIE